MTNQLLLNITFPLFSDSLSALLNTGWGILLLIFGILFWNFATVFIHELGHAFPSLLFTKDPVWVVVGASNPNETTFGFRLGRLNLSFVPLFMPIDAGVCYHSPAKKWLHRVIIVLGGTLFTFISASFFMWWVYSNGMSDFWKFNAIFFLGLSGWQLVTNLYPRVIYESGNDGKLHVTDGQHFVLLLREKFGGKDYQEIYKLHAEGKNTEAAKQLTEWRKDNKVNRQMYNLGKTIYTADKQWLEILSLTDDFAGDDLSVLKPDDYDTIGNAYFETDAFRNALRCFEKVHSFNHLNPEAFKKIAKTYEALGNLRDAEIAYNNALEIFPNDAIAHIRMSFVKKGMRKIGEARAHFNRAIELNPKSPHVNYFAAKYLLDNDEYEKAQDFIKVSKEGGGAQLFSDFLELEKAINVRNNG
jgi:tetratricopeptide (TPR) repeat protein